MNKEQFTDLVHANESRYKVYVFASRMPFPISMYIHTWIVVCDNDKVNRYDVWHWKNRCESSVGHVHLNLYDPWVGVMKLPLIRNSKLNVPRSESFVLESVMGDTGSVAQRVVEFLNTSYATYPYTQRYSYYPGPNSNTFTQWVLNMFPELNIKLPWNAVGKNFLIKNNS